MKRDANRAADCLANEGVTKEIDHFYWEMCTSED
jgi:hypothetical protein